MTRHALAALAALALAACSSNPTPADGGSGTTGATAASSSSGGGSSTGGHVSTSGTGSSSGGSTGTTGATGGGTTGSSGGGFACPAGADCALGDGGAGSCCGGTCTDVMADPMNCGLCGSPCFGSQTCVGGSCTTPSCATGIPSQACALVDGGAGNCCGGGCVDPNGQIDPMNCGGCGNVCPTGSTCQPAAGGCADDGGNQVSGCGAGCPAGTTCSITGSFCVADSCADGGSFCQLGNGGLGVCCGGSCTNIYDSPGSCGGCGNACPAGELCYGGSCAHPVACSGNSQGGSCATDGGGGTCCGATCANLYDDPQNCGGCGLVCPTGSGCVQGACVAATGSQNCGPTTCPAGSTCNPSNGACIVPCGAEGDECAVGPNKFGLCCGGACVDPGQDPVNCGACGNACGSSKSCELTNASGICVPPPAGPDGGCGPCPAGNVCVGDLCVATDCSGGATLCSADGGLGSCCVTIDFNSGSLIFSCSDLSIDVNNCGSCGNACLDGGLVCQGGSCSVAGSSDACLGRQGDFCALTDGGQGYCCGASGCADPLVDLANCGGCGVDCRLLFAANGFTGSATCFAGGSCGVASCSGASNELACPRDGGVGSCCSNGCTDELSDPANCGACGTACDGGHCVGGLCQ